MLIHLALKNLTRRPLRTALTLLGLALSTGLIATLLAFGQRYQGDLHRELDGMGMQLMLVPLGCPYDAAAQVLKGRALDVSLPESALGRARADSGVAIAAPIFAAALPRPSEGRTDLWVGVDDAIRPMKPWWHLTPGSTWFAGPDSVVLGAEAAATEMRRPGDRLYSPETGRTLRVCGVLERSGTSDDSQFFVPLATAQEMFHQTGRLTAIAVRLKDPAALGDVSDRLQRIDGAQVVTMAEMMGTFLNLMAAARSLTLASALVALTVSGLGVFNTMLAATLERTRELGVLRAVGFSRGDLFRLMTCEAIGLTLLGTLLGLGLSLTAGGYVTGLVRAYVPLASQESTGTLLPLNVVGQCVALLVGVGLVAGAFPAWQASRLRPAVALKAE